jgi:hypothetical protein
MLIPPILEILGGEPKGTKEGAGDWKEFEDEWGVLVGVLSRFVEFVFWALLARFLCLFLIRMGAAIPVRWLWTGVEWIVCWDDVSANDAIAWVDVETVEVDSVFAFSGWLEEDDVDDETGVRKASASLDKACTGGRSNLEVTDEVEEELTGVVVLLPDKDDDGSWEGVVIVVIVVVAVVVVGTTGVDVVEEDEVFAAVESFVFEATLPCSFAGGTDMLRNDWTTYWCNRSRSLDMNN